MHKSKSETRTMDSGLGFLDGAPSSRIRVLKHLNNQKTALLNSASRGAFSLAALPTAEEDVDEDPNKPKELPPGSMQLFSYYGRHSQSGFPYYVHWVSHRP